MTQDLDALPLPVPTHFRNGVLYAFSADQIRAARREGYELAMREAQEGREPVYQVAMKRGATACAWIDTDSRTYKDAQLYGDTYRCRMLYTSPPPKSDEARDAERWHMADLINRESNLHPDSRKHQVALSAYRDAFKSGLDFCAAIDAALAAQQKGSL